MTAALHLNSITCIKQQETFGDELYLTFNGGRIALPNMTTGATKALSGDYYFGGSASLSLFENDGNHWYDRDDHIATVTISESKAPGGAFKVDFLGGGAHYVMDVDVWM
jgi:hypothetical protein